MKKIWILVYLKLMILMPKVLTSQEKKAKVPNVEEKESFKSISNSKAKLAFSKFIDYTLKVSWKKENRKGSWTKEKIVKNAMKIKIKEIEVK